MSRVLLNKHDKLDRFGLRLDSIESHAAAFYARPQGATQAEIKRELGSVPRVCKKLVDRGFKFKVVKDKDTGDFRFFLLTTGPFSARNEGRKPRP